MSFGIIGTQLRSLLKHLQHKGTIVSRAVRGTLNPLMTNGAFNICCPRDCVSRTANVERTVRHYWVKGAPYSP